HGRQLIDAHLLRVGRRAHGRPGGAAGAAAAAAAERDALGRAVLTAGRGENIMPLSDPVAVYNAASNEEAHLVKAALVGAGVEAPVTEGLSVVGGWVGGLVPEIHKPQVWVDRADVDRAAPVLEEYDRRAAERASAQQAGLPVEVVCE